MNRFDKTKRLLKKEDYDAVFKQAKKIVIAEFIFLYRSNRLNHARLGFAISKKTVAKAHDRNRVKRILRELFRTRKLPAIDMIVLSRRGLEKKTNSAIISNVSQVWDRLPESCEK